MERRILNALDYRLAQPTAIHFLDHLLWVGYICFAHHHGCIDSSVVKWGLRPQLPGPPVLGWPVGVMWSSVHMTV